MESPADRVGSASDVSGGSKSSPHAGLTFTQGKPGSLPYRRKIPPEARMDLMAQMSIGEFAHASGLTPKALRLYDDIGLLRPAAIDEVNGYRYYDLAQLDTALLVARS